MMVQGGGGGWARGGGLYASSGSVIIARSTMASNQGTGGEAGIYGADSAWSLGGGLYNSDGTLTLSNSTLSGNSVSGNYVRYGGGIYNDFGTVTVSNSTLSGNTAGYFGGGIYNYDFYGTHIVTLTNVTLTDNRAGISGGGLYVDPRTTAVLALHNTLIAGNFRGATGTTRDDVHGALDPSGDYNLIGDGTGMTGLVDGVNGNQVGTAGNPIDPLLGPLAANGGPTLTHALLPGSPAIDAGNNAYATDWDQRGDGFPRIVNDVIDIGAFENQGADPRPSPSRLRPDPDARLAELAAGLLPPWFGTGHNRHSLTLFDPAIVEMLT